MPTSDRKSHGMQKSLRLVFLDMLYIDKSKVKIQNQDLTFQLPTTYFSIIIFQLFQDDTTLDVGQVEMNINQCETGE